MSAVGRDFEGDVRALDAGDLPALGEQRRDPGRKAADLTAEDARQDLRLARVGARVDEKPGAAFDLAGPQIAFPPPDADKAQIVERDVAVTALADVPEQHRLAHPVVRRLREGAGTSDGATAIVEPVSDDVPLRNAVHLRLHRRFTPHNWPSRYPSSPASSLSPNTGWAPLMPERVNSPRAANSSRQWRAKAAEARMTRPRRPLSVSRRAARLTAGPTQVKSRRLPPPILPYDTRPTCKARPKPNCATVAAPLGGGRSATLARACRAAVSARKQISRGSAPPAIGKIANNPSPMNLRTSPPAAAIAGT